VKLSKEEYARRADQLAPKSPSWRTVPLAFLVGGSLCALGQVLRTLYENAGLGKQDAGTAVSITLIGLGVLLTCLGWFEKIAKFAGAGTLVPITGFANSVAAPALEFKTEGFVLGTCVKMFTIAGPVLTFGISASVVYGILYWLTTLF
jgi:stage V sporulation protein AC